MGYADGRHVTICPDALRRAEERAKAAEAALAEAQAKIAELEAALSPFGSLVLITQPGIYKPETPMIPCQDRIEPPEMFPCYPTWGDVERAGKVLGLWRDHEEAALAATGEGGETP